MAEANDESDSSSSTSVLVASAISSLHALHNKLIDKEKSKAYIVQPNE